MRAGTLLAGRYGLEQRIASGGMGEVWRAFDRVLGRTVAVKCLLGASPDEPSFVARFRAEARTMATISHPGVVEVYDFGDDPLTGVYLVMKFIEGESLAHTLARAGRLSAEATMRLVAEAAEALHAAHDKGITHRDVKPGNLLLRPDGTALLADFGIARAAGGHSTTGSMAGTTGYIAPERVVGRSATAQSDIYSLGVVAYRCLAGRLPFDGDNPVAVAMRHVDTEPPPLPAEVPPAVRAVVERAMAKDPAARWPSGAALAAQARRAFLVPVESRPVSPAPQPFAPPSQPRFAPAAPATEPQTTVSSAGGRRRSPRRGGRAKTRLIVAAALVIATIATIATVSTFLGPDGGTQPQGLQANPGASAMDPAGNVDATQAPSPGATNPVPSFGAPSPAAKARPGSATAPPAAPKSLSATGIGTTTIRLQWTDASADESGFTITNGVTSRDAGANATTFDWTGLEPETRSCFKIRAFNSVGASAYYPAAQSDWVCATSQSGSGVSAPANLTATAVNTGTIRLQWTDRSPDENGFTIINGAESRNAGANATTYDWTGLAPGTYMCFKIRAFNSTGVSAYYPAAQSDWVCLTTPST